MSAFFLLGNERVEVSMKNREDRVSPNTQFKVVGDNGEKWTVHGDKLLENYDPVSSQATHIIELIEDQTE